MILSRYTLRHPSLGAVTVSERSDARRFIARWSGGEVHLTVPPAVASAEIYGVLDRLAPRLLDRRPALSYHDGMTIPLDGITFGILTQTHRRDAILVTLKDDHAYLEVGSGIDLTSVSGTRAVSTAMCRVASRVASGLLLPPAQRLARRLDVALSSWHIMSGYRTLGKCTSSRAVHLSHALVFLPQQLRDYIVCHELAHLTYMSHSRRFHDLCDRYCGGRERECMEALKAYRWPILR